MAMVELMLAMVAQKGLAVISQVILLLLQLIMAVAEVAVIWPD
jgi:hypothetical protein